jgi:hypothetical protein
MTPPVWWWPAVAVGSGLVVLVAWCLAVVMWVVWRED